VARVPAQFACFLLLIVLFWCGRCVAQGGPPLLTDDPGTPGNNNWEINVGVTTERHPDERIFNAPVLDMNYGAGDRIQLNFQIPWIIRGTNDGPTQDGLGNSQAAVKWRFFDDQKHTLAISMYPRLIFNNPNNTVLRGLDTKGTDFLLPFEFTKKVGPLDVNFEAGHWFTQYGPDSWITGLAFGRDVNERLELLGEIYNEHDKGIGDHSTTFDFGGRAKLNSHFVLLFMAGRSFNGPASGEPQLIGYLGMQFLIEHKKAKDEEKPQTPMPPSPALVRLHH
jgi:hypothetical protein